MDFLFQKEIPDWDTWGKLFQSIADFIPLIEAIQRKEHLPEGTIENLTPGTNAVFGCGKLVYKIYAPLFSSMFFAILFWNDWRDRRHASL